MMREYTVFNVDQCENLPDSINTGKSMRVGSARLAQEAEGFRSLIKTSDRIETRRATEVAAAECPPASTV
jgi:hypothetical protein